MRSNYQNKIQIGNVKDIMKDVIDWAGIGTKN